MCEAGLESCEVRIGERKGNSRLLSIVLVREGGNRGGSEVSFECADQVEARWNRGEVKEVRKWEKG